MKKYFLFLLLFCFSSIAQNNSAEPPLVQSLDDLMKLVQKERIEQKEEFKTREAQFSQLKNQQQKLLNQAQKELLREENIRKELQKEFEKHEKELNQLSNELKIIEGNLGELFGAVKQTAGKLRGDISSSIVSAQIKNRENTINNIAEKSTPTIQELRRLWLELQLEAVELGRTRTFKDFIVLDDGQKEERSITRVGGFNLVSQGRYLTYKTETKQIVELAKQPPEQRYISALESSSQGHQVFALDPSRGAILDVLMRKSSLLETVIQEAGAIGFLIIVFLFIGLGISTQRWLNLRSEKNTIQNQLEKNEFDPKHPIGKLRLAFEKYHSQNTETLEIKLDEIIVQSLPRLEKGISWVKLLAAAAPLLGLLGTVYGMIMTFQSITLFGAGDPKVMAGGISHALITTLLGISCAIPLLFCHNFISGKYKEIIQLLEEQAAGLLAKKMEDKSAPITDQK